MVVVTKTRGLGAAVMLSVGTLWPALSQADQPDIPYTITTPDTSAVGYVMTSSVSIKVTSPSGEAPSNEAIRHLKVTLNGLDEPNALSQGGAGVLSGLKVGPNTILLFESKNSSPFERTASWEQVAQLVVERATGPAVTCASLATPRQIPDQAYPDHTYRVPLEPRSLSLSSIRRRQPCPSTAKYRDCCGRERESPGPPAVPNNTKRSSRCACQPSGTEGICFRAAAVPRVAFLQRPGHRPARLLSPS